MEKRLFLDMEYEYDVKYKLDYFGMVSTHNNVIGMSQDLSETIDNSHKPVVRILDKNNNGNVLYKIVRVDNSNSQSEQ